MEFPRPIDHEELRQRILEMRGAADVAPDLAVVIPVNAQGDLENVLRIVGDVARYRGPHEIETILVVNNYPAGEPPAEIEDFRNLGLEVVAIPSVRRPGEAVGFSARIPGVRAASCNYVALFDADCRIPDATRLLDWYFDRFEGGAEAAYTHVAYYEYKRVPSILAHIALHHGARWIKRNLLRIPTTRGSNYAVRRDTMLELYDEGLLADEMNVGPTFKRLRGPVAYSGRRALAVYTSARMFRPSWRRKIPYFLYRLKYNLRVLPVRADVASRTGRENDPVRRYADNRPVRDE
jgi:hypothetical protein